jgi:hypothetical protein
MSATMAEQTEKAAKAVKAANITKNAKEAA